MITYILIGMAIYFLIGIIHAVVIDRIMKEKGVPPLEGPEFMVIFFATAACWPLALLGLFFDL